MGMASVILVAALGIALLVVAGWMVHPAAGLAVAGVTCLIGSARAIVVMVDEDEGDG